MFEYASLAGSFLQRSPSTCSQGRDVTPSVDRSSVTSATESDCELLLQPVPLLRMDSKGERSASGDAVTLAQVRCHGENLFIQVETTAPSPKRRSKRFKKLRFDFSSFPFNYCISLDVVFFCRKRPSRHDDLVVGADVTLAKASERQSASSREGGDELSSEASELDSRSQLPAWLRDELRSAERFPVSSKTSANDTTSEHSLADDDVSPAPARRVAATQETRDNLTDGTCI